MQLVLIWIFHLLLFSVEENPQLRFHGLKVYVADVQKAEQFYSNKLGFQRTPNRSLTYETGFCPIYIEEAKSSKLVDYPNEARIGLTLQTFKLLPQSNVLRSQNVLFHDSLLSRNGVGISIPFDDPSGNKINLMEVQIRPVAPFEGVRFYNCGVTVGDMDKAIGFYVDVLGFKELSRNYLPDALPLLNEDGSFAFMIHYKEGISPSSIDYGEQPHFSLILETSNLTKVSQSLFNKSIEYHEVKNKIIIRDPFGNYIEIISAT